MAWSKSTRISIMLVIDIIFFLVELISGFLIHSLALTADAFHMLNDIISLLVGLWAVSVARKATTDKYSYGWLRAEILGAFFNAVFLIALCVSIILEAITRFVSPSDIDNPKIMLIVGSLGLASNLVGFAVLGGHGHGHDHDHGEQTQGDVGRYDQAHAAEEGHAGGPTSAADAANEAGPAIDVLPHVAIARAGVGSPEATRHIRFSHDGFSSNGGDTEGRCGSTTSRQSRGRERRRAGSLRHSHSRLTSIDDISIHPASFRQEIIAASRSQTHIGEDGTSESEPEEVGDVGESAGEETPLINVSSGRQSNGNITRERSASGRRRRESELLHTHHHHNKPKKTSKKGHSHSHGDMGMNAMILHVLGDALGNVGVIVTALIIWLTDWPGKLYADPAVSLFITLIILRSAVPLTSATAKILLQATPDHIDVSEIREDIECLPGVRSCHHIHIWQLSDTKIVASMHIQVEFPISEASGEKYMELARRARKCLHAYGIHSATIQPEFCLDKRHRIGHMEVASGLQYDGAADGEVSVKRDELRGDICLLECVEDCAGLGCCAPTEARTSRTSSHASHGHNHSH